MTEASRCTRTLGLLGPGRIVRCINDSEHGVDHLFYDPVTEKKVTADAQTEGPMLVAFEFKKGVKR